jgi:hypothetical protein
MLLIETAEGLEKDMAVSYLSRYAFLIKLLETGKRCESFFYF